MQFGSVNMTWFLLIELGVFLAAVPHVKLAGLMPSLVLLCTEQLPKISSFAILHFRHMAYIT